MMLRIVEYGKGGCHFEVQQFYGLYPLGLWISKPCKPRHDGQIKTYQHWTLKSAEEHVSILIAAEKCKFLKNQSFRVVSVTETSDKRGDWE